MADQRTMAELLHAPTEGYAKAITNSSDYFFGLEKDNPHDHIHWFNKTTSTIKYKDVPNSAIKLMLFAFSLTGAARCWLEKESPRSILTWEDLVSKFINEFFPPSRTTNLRNEISNFQQRFDESFHDTWDRYKDVLHACPHHGFTELHQLDTFYNALNPADQDSLNSAAGGNLLERRTQDVLTIIENKSKDNIQGYVSAATVNYNQGNFGYRPLGVANQIQPSGFAQANVQNNQNQFSQPQGYNQGNNFNQDSSYLAPMQQNQVVPLSELEKIKKMNEINMKAMQTQINNVKNELRNEMKTSIQASINIIANPKGELKSITTLSGLVLDGPSVPMPPSFINPEEDERVEETLTDLELDEFTIKVPPPLVKKPKPPSQRNYVVHQRDPFHPNILYPLRMHKQKHHEKDKVQIHKFWQMFKQLHINITLADALILILNYQKMLKSLLFNKEKLLELANTPLNENCSAIILKKLPEKVGDPVKFLISCGFSELKCKALADLGASINLMPLSVWKKLGLPELISTRVTLELSNWAICTPAGIARDVFVLVGKFTFPADFVIVDYESESSWEDHSYGPLFADELALITFPPRNDDLLFDIKSDLREIEYLLNHDPTKEIDSILEDSIDKSNLADLNDNLFDTIPEMFIDEHALDYSSPPLYDEYDDDLDKFESNNDDAYNDPFDSKGEKIKESKLLIDELDLARSSDFLPSLEYDSFLFEDFFRDNTRVAPDENVMKIAISHASLILENVDHPLSDYELPFHKEVLGPVTLLSFSFEIKEKVFKPRILTTKGVHSSLLPELSHRGPKVFKVIKILKSPMEIFP
nr:hypothetical protein [Tanacetum cinerariifolium]